MRRSAVVVVVAAILVGLIAGRSGRVAASDAGTPVAAIGHPVVGSWLLDTNADDPANPPELVVFSSDGTYVAAAASGAATIGVWEATGDRTAAVTLLFFLPSKDAAFGGLGKVRATVVVDAAGDAFSAPYTLEFVAPDGSTSGELGPATATATRIRLEPMGTPVGPAPVEQVAGTPPA